MRPTIIANALVILLIAALFPQPAAAQVDDWRILHIGLQSGAAVDTDQDGIVNSWRECRLAGNSGNVKCKKLNQSALYQGWQTDMGCFEQTVEGWTDYQIDIVQESTFIETVEVLDANPYDFAWSGWADLYDFESYDVVMVWTAYTQALGFDGGTWNGNVTGLGGYSFIALYGIAGHCDLNAWPAIVPPHEFVHTVTGLYSSLGYPVCNTYDYTEGHYAIMTNTHSPITCPGTSVVSTGIPPEAWESGSYLDYYA